MSVERLNFIKESELIALLGVLPKPSSMKVHVTGLNLSGAAVNAGLNDCHFLGYSESLDSLFSNPDRNMVLTAYRNKVSGDTADKTIASLKSVNWHLGDNTDIYISAYGVRVSYEGKEPEVVSRMRIVAPKVPYLIAANRMLPKEN